MRFPRRPQCVSHSVIYKVLTLVLLTPKQNTNLLNWLYFIKCFYVKLNKFLFVDHAESPRFSQEDPEGWELIRPTLEELDQKMQEAETDSHEGKRKVEALWPIFIIKSRDTSSIYSTEERLSAEVILLTYST
jgi:hypothetical protein